MLVLLAECVEAASALAYAALHQLVRPILRYAAEIPAPQQRALRIAFGVEAGNAPDRFLISVAALSLLSEAATEQPVLCVLDDITRSAWASHSARRRSA